MHTQSRLRIEGENSSVVTDVLFATRSFFQFRLDLGKWPSHLEFTLSSRTPLYKKQWSRVERKLLVWHLLRISPQPQTARADSLAITNVPFAQRNFVQIPSALENCRKPLP